MKKNWFRQFIKKTLVIINAIIAIFFLIGCLLPWLSPKYFWIFGFVGIAMPYLMVLMIFSVLFWLFVKRIFALYFFVLLCLGYKQINVMFAFNSNETFKKVKANYNIRVISWNVGNMSGKTQKAGAKKHSVDEIVGGLLKQNADVICLQEFEDCKTGCRSVELIKKKYPYYFFPGWIIGPHKHGSGCVIFSKYPILKSDSTRFENGENIITTDIALGEDTISFFTTHLDSYRFSRKEFNEIDAVGTEEAMPKINVKSIVKKMKNTLITHEEQAEVVNKFIATTSYNTVFCGDLNEVANNNTYWKIRGNKQDAFLAKGFGLGKTFNSLSPVLRIDYIMPDKNFEVTQFNILDEKMSDHKMLIVDLLLKKYQTEKTKN